MTYKEQLKSILDDIQGPMGLDTLEYHYPEIENKTFQKLRERYVKSKERILHYLEKHAKD